MESGSLSLPDYLQGHTEARLMWEEASFEDGDGPLTSALTMTVSENMKTS
jgi:hypothetical protein